MLRKEGWHKVMVEKKECHEIPYIIHVLELDHSLGSEA